MTAFLPALLAAAAFDGQAALRHASALAALGPHPWGSPRARVAAEYVAAQFRDAGLEQVRLEPFEAAGLAGANVVGVLPGPGSEFVVVGAHHDTAPGAPGAYDDGGGVGVLVEAARVLARETQRPRTIVFVSWDGEEAWSTGQATTSGSRAYLAALGPRVRDLTAALAIEMCGWKGGAPVAHPIAYADPLRPGRSTVAPAWLVQAALDGARRAGAPIGVGDPLLSWLYQPAVRTVKVDLYGDDLSFLQAGHPALFLSDSSFTAYYPHYHQPTDTADKLDAAALDAMGRAVLGIVPALARTPRGGPERDWFAVFGFVLGPATVLLLGFATLGPGLVRARRATFGEIALRAGHALLVGVLLWRHPVPALWSFAAPNLAAPFASGWRLAPAYLPVAALVGMAVAATVRGFASGLWLAAWELLAAAAALALPFVRLGGRSRGRAGGGRRARRKKGAA